MLALEGIKILDLTRAGPGPFCTWILGDLGAEVIRVEALPTGTRQAGLGQSPIGEAGRREAAYDVMTRNKKSIGLNLRSKEGLHIFYQLAEGADIVVEGFRPGVAERLGIDYPIINKINPRIIYCSISGYGQGGPYRDLPGHDINFIAMGGVLNLIGSGDSQPIIPLNLLADYGGGGMHAAVGILSALIARTKTANGQYIDISLLDSVISLLAWTTIAHFQYGIELKRGEFVLGGAYPYYSIYRTKDGRFITIGCLEPWLWENLCHLIGKEEFLPFHFEPDHFFHPPKGEKWEEISSSLKQVFLTKTRDEWFDILSQRDIPVGKVNSLDEVFTDRQVLNRQMVIEVKGPTGSKVKQVGIAIKLSDATGKVRNLSPLLGEHTETLLEEMGYSREQINKLRTENVVF